MNYNLGELNIQSIPSEVEIVKEKNGTRDQQYQGSKHYFIMMKNFPIIAPYFMQIKPTLILDQFSLQRNYKQKALPIWRQLFTVKSFGEWEYLVILICY